MSNRDQWIAVVSNLSQWIRKKRIFGRPGRATNSSNLFNENSIRVSHAPQNPPPVKSMTYSGSEPREAYDFFQRRNQKFAESMVKEALPSNAIKFLGEGLPKVTKLTF